MTHNRTGPGRPWRLQVRGARSSRASCPCILVLSLHLFPRRDSLSPVWEGKHWCRFLDWVVYLSEARAGGVQGPASSGVPEAGILKDVPPVFLRLEKIVGQERQEPEDPVSLHRPLQGQA